MIRLPVAPVQKLVAQKEDDWPTSGIDRSLLLKIRAGAKRFVTLDTADRVCVAFGRHLDELYPYEEEKNAA